jgi:hypothetical protein
MNDVMELKFASVKWNVIMARSSTQTENPPRFCAFYCLGFIQVHWERKLVYWTKRHKSFINDFPQKSVDKLLTSCTQHFEQVKHSARKHAMRISLSELGLKLAPPCMGTVAVYFDPSLAILWRERTMSGLR